MPALYSNNPGPSTQPIDRSQWRPIAWYASSTTMDALITLPLWLPTAASLLITAAAWRLDHLAFLRTHRNLCTWRYDRAGLTITSPCPECGYSATPR